MNRDLDQLIVNALEEIAGDAPELGPPPRLVAHGVGSTRTRRWLVTTTVAAVTIGVTVSGLVLLSPSSPASDPVQSPSDSAVEPSTSSAVSNPGPDEAAELPVPDLDALTAGDWLVASVVPDGYEMSRAWSTFEDHQIVYENSVGDAVVVATVATSGASGGAPDSAGWVVATEEPLSANYRGGGWSIDVSATALDASELWLLVDRLDVVRDEVLPVTVLDTTAVREDGALVASVDFDGTVEELYVSGGRGAYCMEGPASGSCPVLFDPVDVSTRAAGGLLEAEDGALEGTVRSMGIAAPEVASIRFELMDGQTIDVIPTDFSGSFDVKFWLLAARVDLGEPASPSNGGPVASPAPIVGATAFDADGNVLTGWESTGS